jgi:hypothetical protein
VLEVLKTIKTGEHAISFFAKVCLILIIGKIKNNKIITVW